MEVAGQMQVTLMMVCGTGLSQTRGSACGWMSKAQQEPVPRSPYGSLWVSLIHAAPPRAPQGALQRAQRAIRAALSTAAARVWAAGGWTGGAQLGLQDLLLPHSGMELSSLHPLGLAPLVSPKTLVPRHPPLHCELCKNCRYWGCG